MRAGGFWKRWGSRGHDGRRSELGNRNVIGMPVCAVGSERDDDIGLYSPQMLHNGSNDLTWVRTVELLVAVVEHKHFTNTQCRRGSAQLRFTDVSQGR